MFHKMDINIANKGGLPVPDNPITVSCFGIIKDAKLLKLNQCASLDIS
ncbi:hypothetical protein MASR2M117_06980 [Paludibacter sp.]